MIKISNGVLSAEINPFGAELSSLKKGQTEYIWCGDPKYWSGKSPILFPICSRLKNNTYTYNGSQYTMGLHGFAMNSEFIVEEVSDSKATFLLTENEETLKIYPFKFEFRATYELKDNSLEVTYNIKNKNDYTMYFSVGSHEGYACDDVENYDIIFDKPVTLEAFALDPQNINELGTETVTILKNSTVLPLYDKYFSVGALIFKNIDFKSCKLRNRITEQEILIEFPQCDYLLIWKVQGAGYVCIEPWSGITGTVGSDNAIETKEGIIPLERGTEFNHFHRITLL